VKKAGEIKLFLGIVVLALILVGLTLKPMLFTGKDAGKSAQPKLEPIAKNDLLPPGTRYRGNAKARYILVEFGDYQCPQCATAASEVDKIVKKFATKLRYVFNYSSVMPVNEHPHAEVMAMAAEAADKQGKFWEMHRALFLQQGKFKEADQDQALAQIYETAKQIGVDVVALRTEMTSPRIGVALDRQKTVGAKARLKYTPAFYLVKPDGTVRPLGTLADVKKQFEMPGAFP
jgi:protein-disulfide isomerase